MKRLLILLAMLTILTPGRAQQTLPEIENGADYCEYMEALQMRRAEMLAQQESSISSRRQRADELAKAAEAETNPDQKEYLLERAAVERRMIGEVFGRIQSEVSMLDDQIHAVEEHYKFVFVEAFPYYRDREEYTKDELKAALKKASPAIRRSETGKALKQYIKTLK